MSFFLFILVNATLFLRPGEIIPELLGVSIYEGLILSCFLFSLPELLHYLLSGSWDAKPITLCVVGILGAIVVSQLAGLKLEEAAKSGVFFLKVLVYYLLLVSVVNTPVRLRRFVFWLVWFTALLSLVTVLQFHEVIQLPTLKVLKDVDIDMATGQPLIIQRLQGTGIFQDPNELCLMGAAILPLCWYQLANRRAGLSRVLWLAPLLLFLYAIGLTKSRGGFLALLAGLGVVLWCRLGPRKTLALAALGLPVVFLAFAGRQTSLSASNGTGQERIQVWRDWLFEFLHAPLFGNSMEVKDQTEEKLELPGADVKLLAHNSYLQGFADLGLIGGLLFLGAFYIALASLNRLRSKQTQITDPELNRMHPYLFGTVAAFALGIMSLSLCYVIPTYLILGLAAAYVRVTPHFSLAPPVRMSGPVAGRVAIAGLVFLAGMFVITRLFINWA